MKRLITITFINISLVLMPHTLQASNAQSSLYQQLLKMDDILFEQSFNQCQMDVLDPIITDDFEFYHDVAGVQNRTEFLNAIKNNICSTPNVKPIRKLVDNSLNVFPLKNKGKLYGAIQHGEHEFYIKEPNKALYKTSVAKFTHLWMLKDGKWQLTRVLSYDHKNLN